MQLGWWLCYYNGTIVTESIPYIPFLEHYYGIFPKSLAEIVSHYGVQELHLSLTQGKWRTRTWGYPPSPSPPGGELWVWFLPFAE